MRLNTLATAAVIASLLPHLAASDPLLALNAGLDVDEDGGTFLAAGAAYLPDDNLFISADLGHSDANTDLIDLDASFVALMLDYSPGPIGLGINGGWNSSDSIVERFHYGGSASITGGALELKLTGEQWLSDLDAVRFDDLPPAFNQLALACDIDNTVLGLNAYYSGDGFGLYGGWRDYEYSDADCDLRLPNGNSISLNDIDPAVLTDESRQRLRRLGEIQRRSGRLQQRVADAAFLERSISAGVYWQPGSATYQMDYFRSEEAFTHLKVDTFTGSITLPATDSLDLELRAGISDGSDVDAIAFVGATLYWYLPLSK